MTMADIRLRKQQLKDDLDVLEDNFEERLRSARTNILKTVNLYEPIRKKPLRVVGMAIAAGVIVGLSRRKKTRNKSRRTDQRPDIRNHEFILPQWVDLQYSDERKPCQIYFVFSIDQIQFVIRYQRLLIQ